MKLSRMAEGLSGSEIIRLSNNIHARVAKGQKIYNFTIGDFDPKVFPIPEELNKEIRLAYEGQNTNYPPGQGVADLRQAISEYVLRYQGLNYNADDILVSGGARPLIYAVFNTVIDAGDKVIFAGPSWNNDHFCHITNAVQVIIDAKAENNFMPTAAQIAAHIEEASLVALCSPLNPTGTMFSEQALLEICQVIWKENQRRAAISPDMKPVYLIYDQVYNMLSFEGVQHFTPTTLVPEMRPYTIYVDAISKAFAATGVRIGWALGAPHIIKRMQAILAHLGAWPPKAEQIATAKFLKNYAALDTYLANFKSEIYFRLKAIYDGFMDLKQKGYKVDAIAPQGALYLTIQLDLLGMSNEKHQLNTIDDLTEFLLDEVGLGLVPFYVFGAAKNSTWHRLSIGTCVKEEIAPMFAKLEAALATLK